MLSVLIVSIFIVFIETCKRKPWSSLTLSTLFQLWRKILNPYKNGEKKKVKKFVRGNRKTFVKLVVTSRECDQRGEEV